MTAPIKGPPWIVRKVFAIAIRIFPRGFRESFGNGIRDTAYAEYGQARSNGPWQAVRLVSATVWDMAHAGIQERFKPTWKHPSEPKQRRREVTSTMEQLVRDFKHAVRGLVRSPGFTFVTVLTLALAIGANVAIFSVVDTVLVDPLPFDDPNRLVSIRASAPGSDFPEEFDVSEEFYVQYKEQADLTDNIALYNSFGSTLQTTDFADRVRMSTVTPSFFVTLGVTPMLGRLPTPTESNDVALISHALWTTRFGADPSIVGRSLDIAGEMRTVIGVMEADLRIPDENTSIWIPYVIPPDVQSGRFFWRMIARVKPGISPEDLAVQLEPLASRLPERFGGSANYRRLIEQHRPVVRSLKSELLGDVAQPLWILLGTVGVVLLIACSNVANLFMVRSEARHHDLAIRQALGASRRRLISTQMSEAIVLGLLGGVGGALLAMAGVPALVAAAPSGVRGIDSVALDGRALAFTAFLALATALVFGLVPAIRSSAPSRSNDLRYGGRGGAAMRPKHLGRDVLVVFQTALALVLLVGSGLLIRSFIELRNVDPGYDTADIFTFQIAPSGDYADGPAVALFHEQFMAQVAALPSVQSVGVVHELPLDEATNTTPFEIEDERRNGQPDPLLSYTNVGGAYFETMGIELKRGRFFTRADHEVTLGNAIISQGGADLLWPGEDPIGKQVRFATDTTGWDVVVGVVANIHQQDFREAQSEMIYFPMVGRSPEAWEVHSPAYVVKTPRAETIAAEVRALVQRTDPAAPMYAVQTMKSLAAGSMVRLSFTALALGLASALALILGAIGLYGVLSYVVAQRTQEIGIRMALGARGGEVQWMVVRQGSRLAFFGVVCGIFVSVAATQLLGNLLFAVNAFDLPTFVAMSAVMLAVGIIASYVPARRASMVDPVKSLKTEGR